MKRKTMTTKPWLGWHVGWLHLDGAWRRCCYTDGQDEAKQILRATARKLGLTNAHACVTRGGTPVWVPEPGEERPVSLPALVRVEGNDEREG
jgi:hypothetical protein